MPEEFPKSSLPYQGGHNSLHSPNPHMETKEQVVNETCNLENLRSWKEKETSDQIKWAITKRIEFILKPGTLL